MGRTMQATVVRLWDLEMSRGTRCHQLSLFIFDQTQGMTRHLISVQIRLTRSAGCERDQKSTSRYLRYLPRCAHVPDRLPISSRPRSEWECDLTGWTGNKSPWV